jgi:hypothetical protein
MGQTDSRAEGGGEVKPKIKPDGEVEPQNDWWCETCGAKERMSFDDVKKHLTEAHGVDVKTTKCHRQMRMHMDGDTWFSYQWDTTIQGPSGEIKLTNNTVTPRAADDMMRFA